MENLSDMYYLIRFIIDRIFVYLRDLILHELSWFPEGNDDLDGGETKSRAQPFTRRAVADFVAFFTICTIFGSFVIFSTKCTKEEGSNCESSQRPVTPESEGEPLELLDEDDDCVICPSGPEDTEPNNAWGDAMLDESEFSSTFPQPKLLPRGKVFHPYKNVDSRVSEYSDLRGTNSQHCQGTQTNERIIQRVTKNRDWLIRRTRSGHVYGKYPL